MAISQLSFQEQVDLRSQADSQVLVGPRATLWADNPAVARTLPFLFAHVGISLTVVTAAEALLPATKRCRPGDFLVIDCTNVADAWNRCQAILAHTAIPALLCHPDKEFVEDLTRIALGPLHWLPPAYIGLSLFDKLRLLIATPRGAPVEEVPCLPSSLTAREQQVQRLVAKGCTNSQIAERLDITPRTVKNHVANGKAKLGVRTRAEFGAAYRPSAGD
jgi:DNA-binding CsgD family transcriptional regulator